MERSKMIMNQNFMDTENIRIFREVLRHGDRIAEPSRTGSSSNNILPPSWEPDLT